MQHKSGKFIVIQGIEGSGRNELIKRLSKKKVTGFKMAFPHLNGENPITKLLRPIEAKGKFTSDLEVESLFFRMWGEVADFMRKEVIPRVDAGEYVFCTGFDPLILACAVSVGYRLDLFELYKRCRRIVFQNRSPDLYIILEIAVETAIHPRRKVGGKKILTEKEIEFQKGLRDGQREFIEFAKREKEAIRLKIIEADKPPDRVMSLVLKEVKQLHKTKSK
jgi:thymidylate kinase